MNIQKTFWESYIYFCLFVCLLRPSRSAAVPECTLEPDHKVPSKSARSAQPLPALVPSRGGVGRRAHVAEHAEQALLAQRDLSEETTLQD